MCMSSFFDMGHVFGAVEGSHVRKGSEFITRLASARDESTTNFLSGEARGEDAASVTRVSQLAASGCET